MVTAAASRVANRAGPPRSPPPGRQVGGRGAPSRGPPIARRGAPGRVRSRPGSRACAARGPRPGRTFPDGPVPRDAATQGRPWGQRARPAPAAPSRALLARVPVGAELGRARGPQLPGLATNDARLGARGPSPDSRGVHGRKRGDLIQFSSEEELAFLCRGRESPCFGSRSWGVGWGRPRGPRSGLACGGRRAPPGGRPGGPRV